MSTVKVYELFAVPGGFSNQTADYSGTTVAVAAASSEEAHALAHNDAWADDPANPHGILWMYRKGKQPDHRLFDGSEVYGNSQIIGHGAGKRAVETWMRAVFGE